MSRKALQRKLKEVTTDVPELVLHYKSATKDIFGIKVDVAKYTYDKFKKRSEELRREGVPLRSYAYGVMTILKGWVELKKLRQLPTNVFLGDWALKKFYNVSNAEWVDFHYEGDNYNELLQTELMVARYYIETASKKFIRFRECVKELLPALDVRWVEMYNSGNRSQLVGDALEILEVEYGVELAKTYNDFVDAKVLNG